MTIRYIVPTLFVIATAVFSHTVMTPATQVDQHAPFRVAAMDSNVPATTDLAQMTPVAPGH